jgi:hypothetical protein
VNSDSLPKSESGFAMPYRRTENVARKLAARHDAIVAASRAAATMGVMACGELAGDVFRAAVGHGESRFAFWK